MGKLEKKFEAETGKEALIAVVGHGEKAYASWGYQVWLEKRVEELEQRLEAGQVDAVVMWRSADEPPGGKTGTWSHDVIAVTNFGNVYSISFYHGMNGGNWQRLTAFEDGEKVYKWCEKPKAT